MSVHLRLAALDEYELKAAISVLGSSFAAGSNIKKGIHGDYLCYGFCLPVVQDRAPQGSGAREPYLCALPGIRAEGRQAAGLLGPYQ
jgi:hypothetical protein